MTETTAAGGLADQAGVHSYTVVEWGPRKAAANARKHGIHFADAVPVLEDEFAITLRDDVQGEERWVTIGIDALARILTVVYTWRDSTVRIISARPATANERRQYLENS
jgi:hypothetical protein